MDELATLVLADEDGPGIVFRGPFTDAQLWLAAHIDTLDLALEPTPTRPRRIVAKVPAALFRQLFPEVPTLAPHGADASRGRPGLD